MQTRATDGMQGERVVLPLCGRIDSTNAAQVEAELNALRAKHPAGDVVLDAQALNYISSAGLRVILRMRKEEPSLGIVNVSPEVYEVLSMTGFTELMPVEKAFRRLSVAGCDVIGQGANGKVYRIDADTIIKVYNDPDSLPDIRRERELARKAFVLGIPTAIPYDVVRVGEGYGSVFELLNATSFSRLLSAEPERLDHYAALYVELLRKIHTTHVKPGDMPDMKAVAVQWARDMAPCLSGDRGAKLIALVEAVPPRDTMLHGDFHTKNIMMQQGEVLLIDMDTLSVGHPVFELASMYLGFVGFGCVDPGEVERFLSLPFAMAGAFWRRSLQLYLGTEDEETVDKVERKAKVVGLTRLMRRTLRRGGEDTPSGRAMIACCRQQLESLVDTVDTLDF